MVIKPLSPEEISVIQIRAFAGIPDAMKVTEAQAIIGQAIESASRLSVMRQTKDLLVFIDNTYKRGLIDSTGYISNIRHLVELLESELPELEKSDIHRTLRLFRDAIDGKPTVFPFVMDVNEINWLYKHRSKIFDSQARVERIFRLLRARIKGEAASCFPTLASERVLKIMIEELDAIEAESGEGVK